MVSLSSHSSLETMSTSSNPPGKLSRRTIRWPIGAVIADAGARDERLRQRAAVLAAVKGTASPAFQCNLHDEAMDLPTAAPPVEGGSPRCSSPPKLSTSLSPTRHSPRLFANCCPPQDISDVLAPAAEQVVKDPVAASVDMDMPCMYPRQLGDSKGTMSHVPD